MDTCGFHFELPPSCDTGHWQICTQPWFTHLLIQFVWHLEIVMTSSPPTWKFSLVENPSSTCHTFREEVGGVKMFHIIHSHGSNLWYYLRYTIIAISPPSFHEEFNGFGNYRDNGPSPAVIGGGKQFQMGAFSRRIARASRVLYHFVWREIAFRRYELFIGRWHGKCSFLGFRVNNWGWINQYINLKV